MRLYTVSAIDSWTMMKGPKGTSVPRLGKNKGPLCVTSGMISSLSNCMNFVAEKLVEGCVSTSNIRVWKGN